MTFSYKALLRLVARVIGEECTGELLEQFNWQNTGCLKLAVSKGLSLGIIAGAMVVKVPQIGKLLLSRSAAGLSFLAYVLETVGLSITFAYNVRNDNPFSTYGETLFMILQNLLIILLMGMYRAQTMHLVILTALYSVFMSSLMIPAYVSPQMMAYLQASTIPLLTMSKLPQIAKIWKDGGTGQLSSLTLLLVWAGSVARVFTTIQEVSGDRLLLGASSLAAILNTVLALQMIYYGCFAASSKTRKQKRN